MSAVDIYHELVIVGGLDPSYVLDRMEPYEIDACMEGLYKRHKESWEQTRRLVYTIIQVNSRNRVDPREVMPLPWDTEDADNGMSDEERERLSGMLNEYVRRKNNGC